ncbi:MAG: molybdopterin-dependent oxidoreductase [Gammaproteobacteria bacterium]
MSDWQPTACVLCENNCGIEVRLDADGRHIDKVRGDEAHPASQGYLCQKASRVDYYQNSPDRVTRPLRRRADGSFEAIDWDTAIREIADRFMQVRDAHGGDKILYYGGGGQGNHLPGAYGFTTVSALGGRYRSNALAQEKTGEGWVAAKMFGAYARTGDFEHCEVAVFIGKNPWHSHGVPRARVALREIARDPERTLVVFDPRVSETAELADVHVRVRPGTDAWALAALVAIIVQEGLARRNWMARHVDGWEAVQPHFEQLDVAAYCAHADVPEQQLRELARRLAGAESVAWYEDLGTQMNRHSTLVSYLQRLAWLVTGSFGRKGTQFIPNTMRPLLGGSASLARTTPVAGKPMLGGLVPCNVIAEEILSDHPERYRAMLVETANPAHSLADTAAFVEAMHRLDLCVVIDVNMTETARHADYVLPVATQYEKAEATFFNFEYPHNHFHLRHPVMAPPADADVLTEAEIHARLVEAIGEMPEEVAGLKKTLEQQGEDAFAEAYLDAREANPRLRRVAPVVLYRAMQDYLPEGLAPAAALWDVAQFVAAREPAALERAGLEGYGVALGRRLFERIVTSPRGFVFSVDEFDASWARVRTPDHRIRADVPELLPALESLAEGPEAITSAEFPFVLSAGERRAYTANTVLRSSDWRRQDREGALRISPQDAARLALADGAHARIRTPSGAAEVIVEISERMQPGHVSLPNGLGLDNGIAQGRPSRTGAATNELTASGHRDFFAGTPWHKLVPAHIEAA